MALLGVERISEILNHATANVPQKTAMLMRWLEQERFPRLQAAERNFRQMVKNLKLPANMSLDHAPAFEKDALTLSIICSDYSELEKVLAVLKKIYPSLPNPS